MNSRDDVVKSLIVMKEMLEARKYDKQTLDTEFARMGDEEINMILQSPLKMFNIDIIDHPVTTRIIYDLNPKVKHADVKKLAVGFDLYIFVVKDKLNANELKKFAEFNVEYQIFDIKELQFNISTHYLQPKFELMTDENAIDELVKKYMLKSKTQFPIILKTDPMAKFLYAKPGNLVKITRYSPTSVEYIVYRCCM